MEAAAGEGGLRGSQERTKWRVTCKRLVNEAKALLKGSDFDYGVTAIEVLIDLLCETRDYNYFRSEDPVAAAAELRRGGAQDAG